MFSIIDHALQQPKFYCRCLRLSRVVKVQKSTAVLSELRSAIYAGTSESAKSGSA